jgi:hypothetical protein
MISIPGIISEGDEPIVIKGISEQLLCRSPLQCIDMPGFICMFGNCFHSVINNFRMIETPSSIEIIHGFLHSESVEVVRFASVSCTRKLEKFLFRESFRRPETVSSIKLVSGVNRRHALSEAVFEVESCCCHCI